MILLDKGVLVFTVIIFFLYEFFQKPAILTFHKLVWPNIGQPFQYLVPGELTIGSS